MSWKNIIKEDLPLYTKRIVVRERKDLDTGKAIYAIGYIFNKNREKVLVYNGSPPFVLADKMK
jgi:bifunctional N-acetylglucosamine-1-phosphate-uridyltransferase/glucosamine-1-phosphate-acetyltransferase GlmU-like protein